MRKERWCSIGAGGLFGFVVGLGSEFFEALFKGYPVKMTTSYVSGFLMFPAIMCASVGFLFSLFIWPPEVE